jgi:hypothetical protein
VYGAVACSYDAVSLLYLSLYVKLSIYLSTAGFLGHTALTPQHKGWDETVHKAMVNGS